MKFKQKILSGVLSLSLVVSSLFISNAATQQLEVHFIDVGQGDATYIEMPDGTDILIDAGEGAYGNTVVNYLKEQEKDIDIEYLIATHPDSDHIGGMQKVFTDLSVKNFYYPTDAPHDTKTWNNVLSLSKSEGCKVLNATTGTTLNLGGATLKFVQPNVDYKDNNEDSVVALLDYNDTEVLLTGDAEATTEADMISEGMLMDIDVLKVGHHGSNSSTTQEFLNKVKPEYSIISVGKNNYGHPTQNILNRLTSIGSKIFRTDLNGNIVVKSDGTNINISSSKSNSDTADEGSSSGKWVKEGKNWYFYANGVKQKGWVKNANKWYYLNDSGAMLTGWQKIRGKWYYLSGAGAMLTGWQQLNNKWYYLESSGVMATGWKQLNGKWYYLNSSGTMSTGWQQIAGKWYYMYGSGVMATNTTIDGWKINSSGVGSKINNNTTNNSGNTNNGSNTSNNSTVYVTPSGKSYHSTKNCTTLKRSKTILSVTLSQAKAQGKSDPCNICVR